MKSEAYEQELDSMRLISGAVRQLDKDARERVIRWLVDWNFYLTKAENARAAAPPTTRE
jgi:hypothetical protein